MTKLLLAAVLIVVVLLAVRTFRSSSSPEVATPIVEDGDTQTLAALAKAGGDLSKATEVIFFLYFPTKGHADSAASVARREGYTTEVQAPVEGSSQWVGAFTQQMVPSYEAIRAARKRFEELAQSLGGEFDGWEAAVTK